LRSTSTGLIQAALKTLKTSLLSEKDMRLLDIKQTSSSNNRKPISNTMQEMQQNWILG
jgi:hypothetical protein